MPPFNEDLIECRFCSKLKGDYVFHLPPECFKTAIICRNRFSKTETINPFDDNWPGAEECQ